MDNTSMALRSTFIGLLIIIVCIPFITGRIKMTSLCGMRIPKPFESEEDR